LSDFRDFIENIIAKTDIVKVVSRYVSLQQKGSRHWGCCPFHHEKTPSFAVTEDAKMFYCFGCETGGNVIKFVEKIESIEWFPAAKILAEEVGIALPESDYIKTNDAAKEKRKTRLKALLKEAAKHYHQNLSHPQAKKATEYLDKRGLDKSTIIRFGLGVSLGFDQIIDHLKQKGFSPSEMVEAGVATQKADKLTDFFSFRLIIPIIDNFDTVIGFSGRDLSGNDDFAKYKNSPKTEIFDKSKSLFGINLVKRKKQKEPIDFVIIVEGHFDAISLHKAGFDMTVASMGTALTAQQGRLLKNINPNCFVSFDGDAAGQKATLRGLDILANSGLKVKVITLPSGLDPDDVINKHGKDFYKNLIQNAMPLTAFKLFVLKKGFDLSMPDGKAGYGVAATNIVRLLDNPIEREEYIKQVSAETGYRVEVLYAQADLPIQTPNAPPVLPTTEQNLKAETATKKRQEDAKYFILSSILMAKTFADLNDDIFSLLDDIGLQRLFCMIAEALKQQNEQCDRGKGAWGGLAWGTLQALVRQSGFEEDEQVLAKLSAYQYIEGDDAQKYKDCIRFLKLSLVDKNIEALKSDPSLNDDKLKLEQLKDLINQKVELNKRPK